jgi:hypothetical protein
MDCVPAACIVTGENILLRPRRDKVNPFYLLAALRTDLGRTTASIFCARSNRTDAPLLGKIYKALQSIRIMDSADTIQTECESVYLEVEKLRRESDRLLHEFKKLAEKPVADAAHRQARRD